LCERRARAERQQRVHMQTYSVDGPVGRDWPIVLKKSAG
jgi:hypothetical protein